MTAATSKRRVEVANLAFYQPPELHTHEDALDLLEGEITETLRALVDMLGAGCGCTARHPWERHALEGSMIEDLAELVEILAGFLREKHPRRIEFGAPAESLNYVQQLRQAFETVERSGSNCLSTSAPLLFRHWQRAKNLRAQEDLARRMRGWTALEAAR